MATSKFALSSAVAMTTFFTPVEPGPYVAADFSGEGQQGGVDVAVSQYPLREYAEMDAVLASEVAVEGAFADSTILPGVSFTADVKPDPYGVREAIKESFKVAGVEVPEPASLVLMLAGGVCLMPRRKGWQAVSKPPPSPHQFAGPIL